MPWPPIEYDIVTAPLPLDDAAFCLTLLFVKLAVLNDEPAPPDAVVVYVAVWVVVWLNVPPPTTESLSAARILLSVLPLALTAVPPLLAAAPPPPPTVVVLVLPTLRLVALIVLPLLELSHCPGPVPSALTALARPPLLALTPGD